MKTSFSLKKQFLNFVLPSMLAFAFSGVYSIVDGLFIGQSIGDAGLSAINFAYPLVVFIQAAGTGIGLGGAVCFATAMGEKDDAGAKAYLSTAIALLLAACLAVTALLLPLARPILVLFGAAGQVLDYADEYMVIISLGAAFQILANGCSPLLRNFGRAVTVMAAMIAGFILNIFLDWLFIPVLGFGMKGAAAATILGQFATMLPCLFGLAKEGCRAAPARLCPVRKKLMPILRIGISPFGLAVAPYLILIMMNKFSMIYGGSVAVAAYSLVSYLVSFAQLLLQGIGDGCQPLLSLYAGQGKQETVLKLRNYAYLFALGTAGIYGTAVFLLRRRLPDWFGVSAAAADLTIRILPVFCFTFLLYAVTRVTTSFLYATRQNRQAYGIIYGEPVVVLLLLSFVLPRFLGLDGVWLTIPLAQGLMVLAGACRQGTKGIA